MKPYEVIAATRSSSLTPTQRLVVIHVAFRAGSDGDCWASATTLAADTGFDEATVRRAIADLVAAGVLSRQVRPGQTPLLRIAAPPEPRAQDPGTPDPRSGPTRADPGRRIRGGPGAGSGGVRAQDPGTPDPRSDDPIPDPIQDSIQGSDPSPQPPPAPRAGALVERHRVDWVADRALAELADLADRGGDVPATLGRYESGEGTLVDAWVRYARPHRNGHAAPQRVWPDAPDGLRRREIRVGLLQAAHRWRARGPPVHDDCDDDHPPTGVPP